MKTILIVEDELIVAENISQILQDADYKVCGMASSAAEALEYIHASKPDLLICDIRIKGEKTGIELIREISQTANIRVIYLTAFADMATLKLAADTQPLAYIVKPFTEKQLLTAVAMALFEQADVIMPTKRELDILKFMALGLGSKEMAARLNISEYTVKTHRKNLLKKYNASSGGELVALAAKQKWILD